MWPLACPSRPKWSARAWRCSFRADFRCGTAGKKSLPLARWRLKPRLKRPGVVRLELDAAGQVVLNGVPVPQKTLPPLMVPVDDNAPCPAEQFPGALTYGEDGKPYCELPVREEILPDGRHYTIIDVGPRETDWYGPARIPANHLFLIGDNRDNSADSRVSLAHKGLGGPVPYENIGGRAEFITFSLDGSMTLNPLTWIPAFRAGRAGMSLHPEREPVAAGPAR